MALPQAPKRQDTKTFPTPIVGDVLFSQIEDRSRATFPAYGTPHPDSAKWPNHKLVFIRPVENARDNIYEFFYCADRANQDLYNFQTGYETIGGILVPFVTRTYVTPRDTFDPDSPAIGSAMPRDPDNKFDVGYTLHTRRQIRSEPELDSLFVVSELTYILNTSASGKQYGEIVTMDTLTEVVVAENAAPSTGIAIISSEVSPIGNGKAIRSTKSVTGGAWPDPVQVEFGKEPVSPPSKYLDYVTRQTTTKKVATIPASVVLTGDQVGKSYVKETPDRAEERTITQSFNLNTTGVEEQIQQRPFVKVTTTVTPSQTPSLPATGNGSSSIVYRSGSVKLYENAVEVAEARVRTAGQEKDKRPFVELTTTKRYDTDGNVDTPTGSSNIVYDDGVVTVFEVNETTAAVVTLTKGTETNTQSWGTIVETRQYSSTANPVAGGSSSVVYSDGSVTAYERSSAITVTASGTNKDVDPNSWGSLTWDGTYEKTSSGARSRQVWTNGVDKVFLNENATVTVAAGTYISAKDVNPVFTEEQTVSYTKDAPESPPSAEGTVFNSEMVYFLPAAGSTPAVKVYRNTTTTITAKSPRTYSDVIQYAVPSVLEAIVPLSFPRRDGATEVYYEARIKEGFTGSFLAEVTEYFANQPNEIDESELNPFKPVPVSFYTPFGTFKCEPTLHEDLSFVLTTGTLDPIYEYASQNISIPATTPTNYYGKTILAAVNSQPYKGGFIVKEYRITLPSA